jgi:hypothetical protein
LLFRRGAENRPELERELQQALLDAAVITITAEVADAIVGTRALIPTCSPSACTETLKSGVALADPQARLPLLQVMINRHNEMTDSKAWCLAVRYLLHGHQSHIESEEMLFILADSDDSDSGKVWEILVQRALAELSGAWRVINSNLATHVSPALRQTVGLQLLHNTGVVKLLHEAGPENLSFHADNRNLVHQIRDVLLRTTRDVALLRALRIHRDQQGALRGIDETTFLANPYFTVHPQLADKVVLIERSSEETARFQETQLDLAPVWGPEGAILLAIDVDQPSIR